LKYVELNPVRAGICKKPSDYKWSSCRYYLGLENENPVIKNREWFGLSEDWSKLLSSQPEEIDLLRKHFRTGRPLGDEAFLLEAERITGRTLIPRKPGPKKNN
jgi:putative transposase